MIDLWVVFLIIVWSHFVFDFVLQSHWMATNKSKSNKALSAHVGVYTIGLCWIACLLIGNWSITVALIWIAINSIMHFVTDWCTSRLTSRLFGKNWHDFFVVVGFDQAIHYTTLVITYILLT